MRGTLSQKVMDWLRITAGTVLMIGLMVGALLLLSVAVPQDVTYSQDEFTVANSSHGEPVTITYEVTTSVPANADDKTRKNRIDTMNQVSACANARLDAHINEHSKYALKNQNLQEVVNSCETGDVKLERVVVPETFN